MADNERFYYHLQDDTADIDSTLHDLISIKNEEDEGSNPNEGKYVRLVDTSEVEGEPEYHFVAEEVSGGGSNIDAEQFEMVVGDGNNNGVGGKFYGTEVVGKLFECGTNQQSTTNYKIKISPCNYLYPEKIEKICFRKGDYNLDYSDNAALKKFDNQKIQYLEVPLIEQINFSFIPTQGGQTNTTELLKISSYYQTNLAKLNAAYSIIYPSYTMAPYLPKLFVHNISYGEPIYTTDNYVETSTDENMTTMLREITDYSVDSNAIAYLKIHLTSASSFEISYLFCPYFAGYANTMDINAYLQDNTLYSLFPSNYRFTQREPYIILNTQPLLFMYWNMNTYVGLEIKGKGLHQNDNELNGFSVTIKSGVYEYPIYDENEQIYSLYYNNDSYAANYTYSFGSKNPYSYTTFHIGTAVLDSECDQKSGLTMKDNAWIQFDGPCQVQMRNGGQMLLEDGLVQITGKKAVTIEDIYTGETAFERLGNFSPSDYRKDTYIGAAGAFSQPYESNAGIRLFQEAFINMTGKSIIALSDGAGIEMLDTSLISMDDTTFFIMNGASAMKLSNKGIASITHGVLNIDGGSTYKSMLNITSGARLVMQSSSGQAPLAIFNEDQLLFLSNSTKDDTSLNNISVSPNSFGTPLTINENAFSGSFTYPTTKTDRNFVELSIRHSQIKIGGDGRNSVGKYNQSWIDIGGGITHDAYTQIQINEASTIRICGVDRTNIQAGDPIVQYPWIRESEIFETDNDTMVKVYDGSKFFMRGTWGTEEPEAGQEPAGYIAKPAGWTGYATKIADAPLLELTDNAECRIHGSTKFKLEDTGITLKDNSVNSDYSFTVDDLKTAIQGGGGASSADDVSYDNTSSGLTATNVQDAIDEVAQSGGQYTLPIASNSTLGGVKVGSGLSISNTGVLSATGGGGSSSGMKIRTLKYIGTGTTPNPIEFPTIPYQILSVNTKGAGGLVPVYVPGFPWGQRTYAGLYSNAGSGGMIYGNFNYGKGSKVIVPSGSDIGYHWNANGAQTEIRYIAAEDLEDNPYESLPFYLPTSDYYYIVQADANIGGRGYSKPNTNPTISFVGTNGSFSTLIHIGLNAADVNNGQATAIATTTTYGGKTWYWTGTGYAMSGSDANGAYSTWPSNLTYDSSIGSFSEQDIQNILDAVFNPA